MLQWVCMCVIPTTLLDLEQSDFVFVQAGWALACSPSWTCLLGEYSKDGISPRSDGRFSDCHHYLNITKIPKLLIFLPSFLVLLSKPGLLGQVSVS